jgi:hypothetical protein
MKINSNTATRQLGQFFLCTFLFSWILWLPGLLITYNVVAPAQPWIVISNILKWAGGTGPSVAAIILTKKQAGNTGIKELFGRVVKIKLGYWYLPALLLLPATIILAHVLNGLLFHAAFPESSLLTDFYWIPILFLIFWVMQFSEELGWRGYALDRLQQRWNAVFSSVLLGIIWAVWHIPMFYISGFGQYDNQLPYGQFFITIVLISVLITWLQNNTKGSLVPAFTIHAMINLTAEVLPLVEKNKNAQIDYMPWIISNILLLLIVVAVIVFWGYKKLVRN